MSGEAQTQGPWVTATSVKVRPPSNQTGLNWSVEDAATRERMFVSPEGAYTLLFCGQSRQRFEIDHELSQVFGSDRDTARVLLERLLRFGFLRPEEDAAVEQDIRARWSECGWRESLFFHQWNWCFPFLDYTQETGLATDRARMATYYAIEPELPWHKEMHGSQQIECGPPSADKVPHPLPAVDAAPNYSPYTSKLLQRTMSMTFGAKQVSPHASSQMPFVSKTSPSGGARQPTEGYLLCCDIPGLRPGWYHYAQKDNLLEYVAPPTPMTALCPSAPASAVGAIVMACLWERNMYRYREPRTFRSVYLDAGHLIGTVSAMLRAEGCAHQATFGIDERQFQVDLGLHPLDEGLMAGVLLLGGES